MNIQDPEMHAGTIRLLRVLAYLSTLPLCLAVLLAMHKQLGWAAYTGLPLSFAHINAYIYAHSYGAMLLCLFAGIQLGWLLPRAPAAALLVFYFLLPVVAWLSQQSFADWLGLGLLTVCWITSSLLDWQVAKSLSQPPWLWRLKWHINVWVIAMLLIIMLLNG